jgi:ribosomal protein L37AE/L43A
MGCPGGHDAQRQRLTLEIRDGYPCWRCGGDMSIVLVFRTGTAPSERYGPNFGATLYDSLMAYEKPAGLIPLAARFGVKLAPRGSRVVGSRYIQHCCPTCGANQGDYYVVEDRHAPTRFRTALQVLWCPTCDHWDVVGQS